jgi:hypothetical protein
MGSGRVAGAAGLTHRVTGGAQGVFDLADAERAEVEDRRG